MSYADFIATAWNDHADDAGAVAARLAEAQARPPTAADIVPFARLVTHVYGEHLARWQAGVDLLVSLRALPAWDDGAEARPPSPAASPCFAMPEATMPRSRDLRGTTR